MNYFTFRSFTLSLLGALSLIACSADSRKTTDTIDATPVRVASARLGPGAPPIDTRGKIAAAKEMQLSFKTGGLIARIHVREGERVQRGQLLAELALDEIEAQTAQAVALASKAQRDLERAERLYADEVVSLETLQNARTQADIAKSAEVAARFNLRYSQITAPRDGVVLRRFNEERELVAPGQPVVALGVDTEGYIIRAALSDRELVQVALGDSAEIAIDAYPNQQISGTVREIAGAAEPMTGLFPIEIAIAETQVRLSSGLVATARLQPLRARETTRVYVPIAAVVEGAGRTAHVFANENGIARKQRIEVDFITDEHAAVLTGLTQGMEVVTEGALYLQDGEPIQILESE